MQGWHGQQRCERQPHPPNCAPDAVRLGEESSGWLADAANCDGQFKCQNALPEVLCFCLDEAAPLVGRLFLRYVFQVKNVATREKLGEGKEEGGQTTLV